jgi:hypothetical protein
MATAQRPRLRRVIVRSPADGIVEMTVIVWLGARACALAVRLEHGHDGDRPDPTEPSAAAGPQTRPSRWYCTAIEAA